MNPEAQSFYPNKLNINSQSYIPLSIKENAAKNIQKNVRGNATRRNLTQKKQAASKIQSRIRGNRSRKGKSQDWGLPYPQSMRNLDFDPLLQRRIFEESMYGMREGLEPIREDIEYQTRQVKDTQRILDEIDREEYDPNSRYNIAKEADENKR